MWPHTLAWASRLPTQIDQKTLVWPRSSNPEAKWGPPRQAQAQQGEADHHTESKGPEQVSIKLSKSHKDHRPDELVVLTARVNKVADKTDGEPWWSHGEHGAPTTHQPSPLLPFPHESSNHAKRDILRGSSIATTTASMRSIDPYI